MATLWTCMQEVLVQISAGALAILTEVFRSSLQSFQVNAVTVLQLHHDCFLPNPSQFIIHQSLYNLTLYSVTTKCHKTTNKEQKAIRASMWWGYTDRVTWNVGTWKPGESPLLPIQTNHIPNHPVYITWLHVHSSHFNPEDGDSMFLQILVSNSKTTRCHNRGDQNLNTHCRENGKTWDHNNDSKW
jgi:hypothetical protein